jgi:peptide deformylase
MRLKIVQAGEPVLRQAARLLTSEEIESEEIQNLILWMQETMYEAPGVGLAAPQVGLPVQLAVIEDKPEYWKGASAEYLAERERFTVPFQVLINPRIVERSDEQVEFYEGCLSVAGFSALVKRSRSIAVEYLDERAEAQRIDARGWYARILQHEIDHLLGGLYIDRMDTRTFTNAENFQRYWKDSGVARGKDLDSLE